MGIFKIYKEIFLKVFQERLGIKLTICLSGVRHEFAFSQTLHFPFIFRKVNVFGLPKT